MLLNLSKYTRYRVSLILVLNNINKQTKEKEKKRKPSFDFIRMTAEPIDADLSANSFPLTKWTLTFQSIHFPQLSWR